MSFKKGFEKTAVSLGFLNRFSQSGAAKRAANVPESQRGHVFKQVLDRTKAYQKNMLKNPHDTINVRNTATRFKDISQSGRNNLRSTFKDFSKMLPKSK